MNDQGLGNVHRMFVFLAFFLFLGVSACGSPEIACDDPLGCIAVDRNEPIRIGAMAALSGDTAYLGEDSQRAIQLAILDRDNTLLEHKVELVVTDSGCDADVAKIAAELVVEDEDVIGIVGPTCTVAAETAVSIVNDVGLSLISPAATASRLTNPDKTAGGLWQPAFFRTVPSDAFQAQVAAAFAYNQLNARTAAIIYDETDVSNDWHLAFVEAFQDLGGEITFQSSIAPGDNSIVAILRGAGNATPDVLYLPIFEPEGNLIASRISDITSLRDVNLIGSTGLFSQSFAVSVGTSVLNNMYVVGPVLAAGVYDEFLTQWNGRYNQPPQSPYAAQTYDAANLLLDTIGSVAQADNRGNLLIGLQAIRDTLSATREYPGVSGLLSCSPYGDCAAPTSLGVYQLNQEEINDNQWPPELVWQP